MESVLFARYGVEPRARMLELRAPPVTLGVRETGSGEPVLLMHGITLGAVHWASLMARLPSLRYVAIDMPSHGQSSGTGYSGVDLRRWHTAMLKSCLKALGLNSAHLIGHSYGGMFGLWLALDAPERSARSSRSARHRSHSAPGPTSSSRCSPGRESGRCR
jgi:pimeloyl-ACP methyl ester carboxylesterase